MGIPEIPPRTAAERACAEDLELWETSSTLDEYEERKQALLEKRHLEREDWIRKQPVFHKFPSLPPELRHHIWKLATEDPTKVRLTTSKYNVFSSSGWCGTIGSSPSEYAATAFLPPLMLVDHESHQITSVHYQRAFSGVSGGGGVLAGYPTALHVDRHAFSLLRPDDLGLVQEFTLELKGSWNNIAADKLQMVLMAPNLERLVIEATEYFNGHGTPRLCASLRNAFLIPSLSVSDRNLHEVELKIKTCYRGKEEGTYYFRGSIFDIPGSE
jgi:hypothetical protein